MAIVYISVILEILVLAIPKNTWCEAGGNDDHSNSTGDYHRRLSDMLQFDYTHRYRRLVDPPLLRRLAESSDSHSDCNLENYQAWGAGLLAVIILFRIGRVGHAFVEMLELGEHLEDASEQADSVAEMKAAEARVGL